jgi:hypothetical protein
LNSEDKGTQPELFTEENTDIVDYFETGCKSDRNPAQPVASDPHPKKKQSSKAFGVKNEGIPINCNTSRMHTVMSELFESPPPPESEKRMSPESKDADSSAAAIESSQFGPWSDCVNGMRQRKRICTGGRSCGKEVQGCTGNDLTDLDFGDDSTSRFYHTRPITFVGTSLDDLNFLHPDDLIGGSTNRCNDGDCCPVFGGCRIGIRRDSRSKRVHWCTDPCPPT